MKNLTNNEKKWIKDILDFGLLMYRYKIDEEKNNNEYSLKWNYFNSLKDLIKAGLATDIQKEEYEKTLKYLNANPHTNYLKICVDIAKEIIDNFKIEIDKPAGKLFDMEEINKLLNGSKN